MTNLHIFIYHLILLQDCPGTEGHTTGKVPKIIGCIAGSKYNLDENKMTMHPYEPGGQRLSTPYLPQSRRPLCLSESNFMGLSLLI